MAAENIHPCECGCGKPTRKTASGYNRFAHHFVPSPGLGPEHHNWKGGSYLKKGYVCVRVAGRGYVREHVLVAEGVMGKSLPPLAVVHHIDGDKLNNSPSNLVVCENQAYHLILHRRHSAFAACGDPAALPCGICSGYHNQGDMYVHRTARGLPRARHKVCVKLEARARWARRVSRLASG